MDIVKQLRAAVELLHSLNGTPQPRTLLLLDYEAGIALQFDVQEVLQYQLMTDFLGKKKTYADLKRATV